MSYKLGNVPTQKSLYVDGGADKAYYTPLSTGIANLSPQPDEAFSVFFWGRGTQTSGSGLFVAQRNVSSSPYEGWDIDVETSTDLLSVYIYSNVGGALRILSAKSGNNYSDTLARIGWYHLGFTVDGTGATAGLVLYLNGQVVTTTNALSSGTAGEFTGGSISAQPLSLGFSSWSLGNDFTACQLAVYSGALSAHQVREIYKGKGSKPGPCDLRNMLGGALGIALMGYWLYGNTADTVSTLQDGSGNNYDMTGSSLSEGQLMPARVG